MGVEYALVHAKTGEAFELGKGPWGDWKVTSVPATREAVELVVLDWTTDAIFNITPETPAYAARLVDAIWSFIQKHPGCYVVDDCGDEYWSSDPPKGRQDWEPHIGERVRLIKQLDNWKPPIGSVGRITNVLTPCNCGGHSAEYKVKPVQYIVALDDRTAANWMPTEVPLNAIEPVRAAGVWTQIGSRYGL